MRLTEIRPDDADKSASMAARGASKPELYIRHVSGLSDSLSQIGEVQRDDAPAPLTGSESSNPHLEEPL